jgi:hypothetical protein
MKEELPLLDGELQAVYDHLIASDVDWQLAAAHPSTLLEVSSQAPSFEAFRLAAYGSTPEAESGLQELMSALSSTAVAAPGGPFFREGAELVLVVVSDEPDQSAGDVGTYLDFFRSLDEGVVLHAVIGTKECLATADLGARYDDAANALGGDILPICSDWGAALELVPETAGSLETRFGLSLPVDETTLVVEVDGVQAGGWSYDAASPAIVFDEPPPAGSTIVVTYEVLTDCE